MKAEGTGSNGVEREANARQLFPHSDRRLKKDRVDEVVRSQLSKILVDSDSVTKSRE